ncbi:MAG: endonuclease domain-containing protein [Candidatus Hydrogenedentota bacterium]|nr:MAG: endonuclease domain-containing protein [Candidatus Hydrogenedentota bacterium]
MVAKKQEEKTPKGEFTTHYRLKTITEISRRLRKRYTKSEDLLWQALRGKKLGGLKFRRQHPFGSSIVDFYCHEKRLVVEIDGAAHLGENAQDKDKIRREIIEKYGVHFLRLLADEVERDLKGSLSKIKATADEIPHP